MLFQVSKSFTGREFADAVNELSCIIAPSGIAPDGSRLIYASNGFTGDVEVFISRDNEPMQLSELSDDKQTKLMLWKLKYSG